MDRFTSRFFTQVQVLQDQLENLLSKDWGPQNQAVRPPFEVLTDLTQLETLGWALPEKEPGRSQVLFDRLSPYFESGLCFHYQSEDTTQGWIRWRLECAFIQGQIYPLLPEDLQKQVALPQMNLTEIRRMNASALLGQLSLKDLGTHPELSCLVIRPAGERLWVLFSNLPDLFLKTHITAIQETSLKLLADYLGEE